MAGASFSWCVLGLFLLAQLASPYPVPEDDFEDEGDSQVVESTIREHHHSSSYQDGHSGGGGYHGAHSGGTDDGGHVVEYEGAGTENNEQYEAAETEGDGQYSAALVDSEHHFDGHDGATIQYLKLNLNVVK
ncbi:hypothetical protein L9F63_009291, partial [Diploptera punctata]